MAVEVHVGSNYSEAAAPPNRRNNSRNALRVADRLQQRNLQLVPNLVRRQ
jgi:hypothetical protein